MKPVVLHCEADVELTAVSKRYKCERPSRVDGERVFHDDSVAVVSLRAKHNNFTLYPTRDKAWLVFYVEESDVSAVSEVLRGIGDFDKEAKKGESKFYIKVDAEVIRTKVDLFRRVAGFVKKWREP